MPASESRRSTTWQPTFTASITRLGMAMPTETPVATIVGDAKAPQDYVEVGAPRRCS